jgi:hypothetical protein
VSLARPEPSDREALLGGGGAPSLPAQTPSSATKECGRRLARPRAAAAAQARLAPTVLRVKQAGVVRRRRRPRGARACRLRRRWCCTALNDAVRGGLALGRNNGRAEARVVRAASTWRDRESIFLCWPLYNGAASPSSCTNTNTPTRPSPAKQRVRGRLGKTPRSARQMSCQSPSIACAMSALALVAARL